MFIKVPVLFLLAHIVSSQSGHFSFNGFLCLNGGHLRHQPDSSSLQTAQMERFVSGNAFSFSTAFVFVIVSPHDSLYIGHGMAFFTSPTDEVAQVYPSRNFGLFNATSLSDPENHVFAVELDTYLNKKFRDIDSNHVGIDVNGLASIKSASAGYYSDDDGGFKTLRLGSGKPMLVWLEYDGQGKKLNVTLQPIDVPRPSRPLLALDIDLSTIILDSMYVGFSSCTAVSSPYILAWSFKMNGEAQAIDVSHLSSLAWQEQSKRKPKVVTIGLPFSGIVVFFMMMAMLGADTIQIISKPIKID